ncbi:MAG TPA: hypothetical protein VFR09_05755 [Alphaproteobacteria bacterium]|nr:hypothetical protein [Alphaproteobacteria bacterium]
MSEFVNRMTVQRRVLQIVNRKKWEKEALFGLSGKAIERWLTINLIDPKNRLAILVKEISSKLFFLASKSQEQVSEDYRLLSEDVSNITERLEHEVNQIA